jgi:hypothetical protein
LSLSAVQFVARNSLFGQRNAGSPLAANNFLNQAAPPSPLLPEDLSVEIYPDDITFAIRTRDLIRPPPT